MLKRFGTALGWLVILGAALGSPAQLKVGDNTEMNAGALMTVGYQGSYGDQIQSSHSLELGLNGTVAGSYYNPNFINFNISPYYNQSRANSDSQSLTNASGVAANVNFFSGSHFPGSVNYSYTYNSTGNFGLTGAPNFTSVGTGQGFGINWSALIPDWPSISAGYTQGSGSGNLYGTDQTTNASSKNFNLRSSYALAGFNLNAYYDHSALNSVFPAFLAGQDAVSDTHGNNLGFNASHQLLWNGQFYANYNRSSFATDYQNGTDQQSNNSNYTTNSETAGVNFHPTDKLSLFGSESYIDNLSGYFTQGLINSGTVPAPVNFGSDSHSYTLGGGASYQITRNLTTTGQVNYYNQTYFGQTYTGTYLSGMVNYNKQLLHTFTFSGGVVDSYDGQGINNVGFVGNINAFHRIGYWELAGAFSYAQNVQSVLITYTNSFYNYNANVHRRFGRRVQWTAAFNGSHSGLTNQPGTVNHSESYSTSLAYKWITANAMYVNSSGNSLLTNGGLIPLPPLPGQPDSNVVTFAGSSYGGGFAITPFRRLTFSGAYNRSLSNTLANSIASRNNLELLNFQLQYRLRRVGFQAGYTRFSQGISATGVPAGTQTSYFAGISRWFDFF